MARPFLNYPIHSLPFARPISFLFALVATISIFSVVTFVCAFYKTNKSHKKFKEGTVITSQSGNKKLISRISMVKLISWRKLQADEEDISADDQKSSEEEVWRKTIMRGERCRPLDFSGKIVYDSQGNLLHQESPP